MHTEICISLKLTFMRNTYILSLLLFAYFIQAQNTVLTDAYNTGFYLFELSDEQADTLYRLGMNEIKDYYFDNPYKIFASHNAYYNFDKSNLPTGHYLVANPRENRLNLNLYSSYNCSMTIVDNNTDLLLQFHDKSNNLLTDNMVKVKQKRLAFDKKSSTYRIAKSRKDGIVMIEHLGHKNYFKIEEKIIRNFWHYLMTFPNYRWISYPFRKVKHASRILYYAIKYKDYHNYTSRLKWSIEQKLLAAKARICPEEHVISSYATFSKPKYKIGDTLKFNAFLLDHKNHYYTDSILVFISGFGVDKEHKAKYKLLKKITADVPGSYNFELALGKDIQLLLDRPYDLILKSESAEHITSLRFRYEQYELSSFRLKILNQDKYHERWKDFEWQIKAVDENQLPILDGKLHLYCKLNNPLSYRDSEVFVPFTLLDTIIDTDPLGTTVFPVDSSLFPAADFTYDLTVTLENEEGKEKKALKQFIYQSKDEKLNFEVTRDSISFNFIEKGQEKVVAGSSTTFFPMTSKSDSFRTDQSFAIDPLVDRYTFNINKKNYALNLLNYPDLLQFYHTINKDSLTISSDNPRNISFSYFLYQNDKEIKRGYGKSIDIKKINPGKHTFTLMVQYKWGSQIKNQNIVFTNKRNQLNLDVQHLDKIYPGEEVDIKIKVTDFENQPVESLNMLAHSLTAKFNHKQRSVKQFKEKKKYKQIHRDYKEQEFNKRINYRFNFEQWNEIAALDSIEFYRFLYPGDQIYRNYMPVKDSITQVIPFIFNNGHTESPQIVYIDYQPVYFAWSNQINPYAFQLSPGYHRIKVRTQHHEIEITNLEIKNGVKNIISIDLSKKTKNVKVFKKKNILSSTEKKQLFPRIALLDGSANQQNKAFISNRDTSSFFAIPSQRMNMLIGPINFKRPIYHDGESFSIPFNLEANYRYYFRSQLIKMKSLEMQNGFPREYPSSLNYPFTKSIHSQVYTKTQFEKDIETRINNYISKHIISETNKRNRRGNNQLIVRHKAESPIFKTIIYNLENAQEIKVYNSYSTNFKQLPAGKYGVIYLNNTGQAQVFNSLHVLENGVSYYDLSKQKSILKDSFGTRMQDIIFEIYDSLQKKESHVDSFKYKLRLEINELQKYKGPLNHLFGQILDISGDPIIGATVQIQGASKGAITDFDGNFKLAIPLIGADIIVSYIGLETLYKTVGIDENYVVWTLNEGSSMLEEVSIVAYKVPLVDFDQTSSVKTVTAESIANSPLKSVQGLAAISAGISVGDGNISIRGSRSNATNYYVDGIRVTNFSLLPNENNISSVRHITGNEAQKGYGSNEVYLISTIQDLDPNRGSSLRRIFSDVGFWKPNVVTDKNGEATIKVTFPDDITKWNLHFYAVSNSKKSGQKTTFIRSYKPLSTSLKTPKFLIEGDYSKLITKVQNYQLDSTFVESKFSINDSLVKSYEHWVSSIAIDSLEVEANGLDTIKAKFSIETPSNYKDGEQHEIPVLPKGMLKAEGFFTLLQSGEKWKINTDTFKSDMTIYVESNQMQLIRGQITHIKNYEHLCNEQLASKLLALLIDKKYCLLLEEEFIYDELINEIIKKLKKRYSHKTYWGWWSEDEYIPWISAHVSKVLLEAKKMGYKVDIELDDNLYFMSSQFISSKSATRSLDILETMQSIDTSLNINVYMEKIDTFNHQTFRDSLRITLLKVQANQDVDLSFIKKYMNTSMLGEQSIKYKGVNRYYHISNNNVLYTILAFRIFNAIDPILYKSELNGMSLYLMGSRINGHYRNTYEGIKIIDLLSEMNLNKSLKLNTKPAIIISGEKNQTITKFPFKMKVKKGMDISIENRALGSMFFTTYSKYWEEEIEKHEDDFVIETSLNHNLNDSISIDRKDKVDLNATVTCKKSAEYTMIEIPIPAGASYHRKGKGNRYEVHREYFDHKVLIFCKYLPTGTHQFTVELKTNYAGNYTLNPAKVEMMYFPTFYGNTNMKEVNIK